MSKSLKLMIVWVTVLGILLIGATFALWLISSKQTTFNTINSGCIDLSFNNGSGSLSLTNSLPMTDSDGLNLTGYTFTLTNNCKTPVSYLLNLDLFNVANSTNLTTSEIKLAIDNKAPRKIAYYDDTAKNAQSAYGAKTITSGKLAAKASETHTVKMWVDENTTKQNAVFSNRLFVMASPNLTVPEVASDDCFVMDGNGKIVMYKTAYCPNDVIIPNVIQNQTITSINEYAFVDFNVLSYYDVDNEHFDFVIMDEEHYNVIYNLLHTMLENDLSTNGVIEYTPAASYTIYKASEYPYWSNVSSDVGSEFGMCDDLNSTASYVFYRRLNIPINLTSSQMDSVFDEMGSYISAYIYDADPLCEYSICYVGFPDGYNGIIPTRYLHSIDLSRLTSLTSLDRVIGNKALTRIEFPNNTVFTSIGEINNNGLTELNIPTYLTSIYYVASNNLTHVDLYSSNNLTIGAPAFNNNNISSLVVNSTITFQGNGKPFDFNSLQPSGITIGHNSTNTAADFITIN